MIRRLSLLAIAVGACGYVPPRFADRPPVTRIADEVPIPVPRARTFIEEVHQADVYVRRELVGGMDPRRSVEAVDVSSLDEVPRSSWFHPPRDPRSPLDDYQRDGPPRPPFTVTGELPTSGMPGTIVIRDARGLPYELLADLAGRPHMRTAAVAISSRLLHAIGYLAPEVHIIRSHTGERVAAVRWPVGVDLGPTRIGEPRSDDANDVLPHLDRRTLRALPWVTGWLGNKRLRARALRDVYVGETGKGHVEHWLVGLDGSLGIDDYLDALALALNPDRESRNFFLKLFSLGLSPKPYAVPPVTPWTSVGLINEHVLDDHLDPSPPFEPLDHLTAADAYWAAKRIAAIPPDTLVAAVRAGELEPDAERWMIELLNDRRAEVIARGYDGATPCELLSIEPRRLLLADLAVQGGFIDAGHSRYRIRYLDAEGDEVEGLQDVPAEGPLVSVPMQRATEPYLVVQVVALRAGIELPRAFEIHLVPDAESYRLLGIRH